MVQKINGFEKTSLLLEEIDEAIALLQKNFEQRKDSVKNIKQTTEQSIKQIDNLVSKLDKVLK